MKQSEQIDELLKALFKAQYELEGVKKDSNNPFFKSKYADLTAVMAEIRPVWQRHGIGFIQWPVSNENKVGVITRVFHAESGQYMEQELLVHIAKADPQAAGSAVTYCRRYSLQTISGLPSIDDDGEAAMLRVVVDHAAKKINRDELSLDEYLEQVEKAENGKPILSGDDYLYICERLAFSIEAIKEAIADEAYSTANEAWSELSHNEQMALWRAPTQGGCFTTKEREIIKNIKQYL